MLRVTGIERTCEERSLFSHAPSVSSSVLIRYVRTLSSLGFTNGYLHHKIIRIYLILQKYAYEGKGIWYFWASWHCAGQGCSWWGGKLSGGASSFSLPSPPSASLFACRPRHSSARGAVQVLVGAGWTWGPSADRKSSEFSGRQWENPWRCGSGEEQDQVGVVEREPWHQQKIRYWRRSRDKLVRSWLKYIVEVRASQRDWWGGKQEGREEDMVTERQGMTTGGREAEWWEALEYHWGQEAGKVTGSCVESEGLVKIPTRVKTVFWDCLLEPCWRQMEAPGELREDSGARGLESSGYRLWWLRG